MFLPALKLHQRHKERHEGQKSNSDNLEVQMVENLQNNKVVRFIASRLTKC